jgi:hypothetical protein
MLYLQPVLIINGLVGIELRLNGGGELMPPYCQTEKCNGELVFKALKRGQAELGRLASVDDFLKLDVECQSRIIGLANAVAKIKKIDERAIYGSVGECKLREASCPFSERAMTKKSCSLCRLALQIRDEISSGDLLFLNEVLDDLVLEESPGEEALSYASDLLDRVCYYVSL